MRSILLLTVTMLLAGCGLVAQKKTDELLSRSTPQDWGVLDANHEDAERLVILQMLKDPDSAKIRFGKPTRGVAYSHGEPVLAWFSPVYVNAKNSFGGYVGEKPYAFAYRCQANKNCKLIKYAIPDNKRSGELDWQE